MTITDLYTAKDVQVIRDEVLKNQRWKDACTFLDIPSKQACLDHSHDNTQLVRGVLHRQVNSYIGKLENNFTRMLGWWYPFDLPDFLEQAADYLRKEELEYRHPNWIKKVKTEFNKLSASQQNKVLELLGSSLGSNPKIRKELFAKVVLQRELGYDKILLTINRVSNAQH
jgi:hypothetical protein